MTSRPKEMNGPRYAINGLVFALIVCAVGLGAAAGWMRYTKKKTSGFEDAAQQAMGGLLPGFSLTGGVVPTGRFLCPQCQSYCWTQGRTGGLACPFCKQAMVADNAGILPVAAAGVAEGRFVCPQCGSFCMTQGRGGFPICPFCKQRMVEEAPTVLPVAGVAATAGSPISIQAGVKPIHGNRGPCTNCHIVNRQNVAALNVATLTPAAAAPPIAADAVKPVLIKPFGMEVCPAPGDGAKVTGVMGNSNASRAGLVAGDIIVECNGKKVADAAALQQLVTSAAPEANAQLKVMRNGRLQKVAVMVGEGEMEGFTPIPKA